MYASSQFVLRSRLCHHSGTDKMSYMSTAQQQQALGRAQSSSSIMLSRLESVLQTNVLLPSLGAMQNAMTLGASAFPTDLGDEIQRPELNLSFLSASYSLSTVE